MPSTVKKSKMRDAGVESRAQADVAEYLERYRNGDATIMDGVRKVVDAKLNMSDACCRMRKFLVDYGVSRTFAGLREDTANVLAPIVMHLRSTDLDASDAVDRLADACKAAGFHRNLSFASKFVNMLGRPVPLYSSEAKAYLRVRPQQAYDEYAEAWFNSYEQHRRVYEAVAEDLFGEQERQRGLTPSWLAMRGFDVMLMAVGGPMR